MGDEFDIPNEIKNVQVQHYVKVFIRPSLLDNNVSWRVFKNDEKILNFLIEEAEFSHGNQEKLQQQFGDQVIQLKKKKCQRDWSPLSQFSTWMIRLEVIKP